MKARWIHKIETSSHCNFTCVYCPNPYGLGYGHGNMTMETFERVVYWAGILNPIGQPKHEPIVWLHGIGEPLLNKKLTTFIEMLRPITQVGFSTNGELLTDEKISELDEAGLSHLTISTHDEKIASEALQRIVRLKPSFECSVQTVFNDDWAGQIPDTVELQPEKTSFHCAHIETGGIHVLFNGSIANCCVDAQGYPILGGVFDSEIRGIDIDVIPLCRNCRSSKYVIPNRLGKYSLSLDPKAREKLFWQDVERETFSRNVAERYKPNRDTRIGG